VRTVDNHEDAQRYDRQKTKKEKNMKTKLKTQLKKYHRKEDGLTLLEYAAGAAFVLMISAAAFAVLQTGVTGLFGSISANIDTISTNTAIGN